MALSKLPSAFVMAVVLAVLACAVSAQSEAPAPAPVSDAGFVAPSFLSGLVAAVIGLVFGSALRI